MSLQNDKKQVFDTIGLLRTMASQPLPQSNLLSYNTFKKTQSKNTFLFLIELLISLVGVEVLKTIISTTIANQTKKIDKKFKETLKKELSNGFSDSVNTPTTVKNGIKMSMNDFDSQGILKVDPTSTEGKLLYGKNDFLLFVKQQVIRNPNNAIQYPKDPSLIVTYLNATDEIEIKSNTNDKYNVFIGRLIDNIVFIDSTIILGLIMDTIFGVVSKQINKSREQILEEQKQIAILNKMEDGDENTKPDDYFVFTKEEEKDIHSKAEYMSEGINAISLGCGVGATTINTTEVLNVVDSLNNSILTPQLVSGGLTNIANSYTKDPNNEIEQRNVSSVQNQFFKELVFALKKVLTFNTLMSPQMKMILTINDTVKNGGVTPIFTDATTQLKQRSNILVCLVKDIISSLNEALFSLVKSEILKIVSVVGVIYAKEAVDKIRNILKTLIKRRK